MTQLPSRALILVVVLAVLGGVVATFMVARPPSSAASESALLVKPKLAKKPAAVRKPAAADARPTAKPKPKATAPVKTPAVTPAKPVAKPKPTPVPVAKPKPAPTPVDDSGLPRVLSSALANNRVVVVGLYDPDAAVDQLALAEARAGALAAGAAFVPINVFAEAQSRPLLELLGTLENPGILVYRKPSTLFARIGGFADRETVAQAAANAR